MIGAFVGFSRIYLLGILIYKGLTARRLYKSFGVKRVKYFVEDITNCTCIKEDIKIKLILCNACYRLIQIYFS
jgi:hypothetical protein